MKTALNAQDKKTLARLVKTYGTALILAELGKAGTKEVSAYAKSKADQIAEQVKPTLEAAILSTEKLVRAKILGGLETLKGKVATPKEVSKPVKKKH